MKLVKVFEYAFTAAIACYVLSVVMTNAFLFQFAAGGQAEGTAREIARGIFLYNASKIVMAAVFSYIAGLLLDAGPGFFTVCMVLIVYVFDAAASWAFLGRPLFAMSVYHLASFIASAAANVGLAWLAFAAARKRAAGRNSH